jgi:hypothetical protein
MNSRTRRSSFLALLLLAGICTPGRTETFLESDEYDEDDEIVGKFLGDKDYRLLVDDVSRNGAELDWCWALAPDADGKRRSTRLKKLGFSFSSYHTVAVTKPANLAGLTRGELDAIHDSLQGAMESLGLELVDDPGSADLVLEAAAVDMNRDYAGYGWIYIEPFVEVELRLHESSGKDLLLARHQIHGGNTFIASMNLGSELARFLR